MKRLRTDKRALPITCHHLVLGELLLYVPRVLAEMIEQYRLTLHDDYIHTGANSLTTVHRCDIDDSMICPFEQLRTVTVNYDLTTRISVTFESRLAEYYAFDREQDVPEETAVAAAIAFVTRRRLPCDMLQECLEHIKTASYPNMQGLWIKPDRSVWENSNDGWKQLYPPTR